jgi:hypothetical protein
MEGELYERKGKKSTNPKSTKEQDLKVYLEWRRVGGWENETAGRIEWIEGEGEKI